MVDFHFSDDQRERLLLALGDIYPVEHSERFILQCQRSIRDWLFVESQMLLTTKETKDSLNDIGKAANKLYKLLSRKTSEGPYQMIVDRRTPELRDRPKVLKIVRTLSERSLQAAGEIKPRGRYRGDRRQLEAWIDEAFNRCFDRAPPNGSGTPLDYFKQEVWEILSTSRS